MIFTIYFGVPKFPRKSMSGAGTEVNSWKHDGSRWRGGGGKPISCGVGFSIRSPSFACEISLKTSIHKLKKI